MPKYKWTLKNKKYCTGCIMNTIDEDIVYKWHRCLVGFYFDARIIRSAQKKRPAACVCELGE